MSPLTTSL